MLGLFNALSSRASSKTNSVTMLAFGVVFLVLGICGVWYWQYVETQTLHLQERNFRALAVTSHALGKMAANYGTAFNAVIKGKPPCTKEPASPCRANAYKDGVEALPNLQDVTVVRVVEDTKSRDEFIVRFVNKNGISPIQLTYVSHDSTGTRWKIKAVMNIGTIMQQLVTEDIFSNVLLADRNGRVLYQHQSTRDASGFEFEDVSSLLHRRNDSESKDSGQEKGRAARKEDLVPTLPLFNEAPIGGISHAIFAQAADLLADRGTAQTLILVGIVPAGQFHAEARAIPLNPLLVVAGLLLTLFFALPYVKLRTNEPTERLTPISVAVLVVSSFMGIVVLTFGLADLATYRNLEQHWDARLKVVSDEIRKQFNDDVKRGLDQLKMFDNSCLSKCSNVQKHHLAEHLCIRDEGGDFLFFQSESGKCSYDKNKTSTTKVVYRDVETMFWVESTGEIKVLQSRDPAPWKYVNLKEREYVRRILKDETLIRKDGEDGIKFWIEPIFSRTTGENTAVFSKKSESSLASRSWRHWKSSCHHLQVLACLRGWGLP